MRRATNIYRLLDKLYYYTDTPTDRVVQYFIFKRQYCIFKMKYYFIFNV